MQPPVLLLVVGLALVPAGGRASDVAGPEGVVVPSGALELRALLWRPQGCGKCPAVLFNHGSGHAAGVSADGLRDQRHPELLGPVFARHGYVFLYLFRRGDGLSAHEGLASGDLLDKAFSAGGQDARNRTQVELMEDEKADVLAGLSALRALPRVDPARVAIVGFSFGGSLSLLAAESDPRLRAVVAFAAGSGGSSWDRSPQLRARLLAAVDHVVAPVFLIYAANDFTVAPGKALDAERTRLHVPHRLEIYPAVGTSAADGHNFVHLGLATWEPAVFAFLEESLTR